MASPLEFKQWFDRHRSKIRQDYFRFLKFRSISADPSFASQTRSCAEWLCNYMKQGGLSARLLPTPNYPIVFAEERSSSPSARTLLAYGHYDVQPVDPLELWESDPFEPTERGGQIYARGASDDKGQIFYAVLAALAWKDLGHKLPVHLKFCIEGEEESQSLGLCQALPSLQKTLAAEDLLIIDFDQLEGGTPAVTLGSRGLAALEISLTGSNVDLHSGLLGGVAYNPNRALVEMLGKLWDCEGRIQIPHFYDDLVEEDASPYYYSCDRERFTKDFGIEAFGGEKGRSLKEANWLRPTLDINGIGGGYAGAGTKTIIPAKAFAKISLRLVPRQSAAKVLQHLETYLRDLTPPGMKVQIEPAGKYGAWRGSPHSPLALAVSKAASEVTGKACRSILSGASIPIVSELVAHLGAEVAGMGYGLSTDRIHAPNEHFDMERFETGFLTFARVLALL